jgi:glycolate oxidase FAD binding subunit
MARVALGAERDVTTSTATAAVVERIRDARAARTPLRIVGGGTWLDAGRPCAATARLDLGTDSGVVEYEPGDLVLTVRAGTSLAEVARVTRAEGQWLPLDPPGAAHGTLGATIATASAGPLASAFGAPRDHLLGCEFVTGAGDVVRPGGRVVKNVAGFDLARLVTGAWGTLGVLTEITVRLRALPEVDRTLAVETTADAAWRWLRTSPFTPLAAELVSGPLAQALGLGLGTNAVALLLRFGGNAALVRAAAESVALLGPAREAGAGIWPALAAAEPQGSSVVRLSVRPSRVAAAWERVLAIVERVGGVAHATLQRGVIRCVVPCAIGQTSVPGAPGQASVPGAMAQASIPGAAADEENARLRGIVGALRIDATCVAERLPPALWPSLLPPAAADPLSLRVRAAFDPDRLLNPGILGELA